MSTQFDHFYFTLNQPSFDQFVSQCPCLELFEDRTTQRKDMTYRGLYLYFEDFYFEILSDQCGIGADAIGIALSDLENNEGAIERIGVQPPMEVSECTKEKKPWFKALHRPWVKDSPIHVWFMQYHGTFLDRRKRSNDQKQYRAQSLRIQSTLSLEQATARLSEFGKEFSFESHPKVSYSQGSPKMELSFFEGEQQHTLVIENRQDA